MKTKPSLLERLKGIREIKEESINYYRLKRLFESMDWGFDWNETASIRIKSSIANSLYDKKDVERTEEIRIPARIIAQEFEPIIGKYLQYIPVSSANPGYETPRILLNHKHCTEDYILREEDEHDGFLKRSEGIYSKEICEGIHTTYIGRKKQRFTRRGIEHYTTERHVVQLLKKRLLVDHDIAYHSYSPLKRLEIEFEIDKKC